MSGNVQGVMRTAARRVGLTVEEYSARVAAGEKWCTACKAWHSRTEFPTDRSRSDGLHARCRRVNRTNYGRYPERDVARNAVNAAVRHGRLPNPSELPCTDCGHQHRAGEVRHEYDHHMGYAAEHRLTVEPVCQPCHCAREKKRRGAS